MPACPKPAPKEKKPRKWLSDGPRKPLKKENPERRARVARVRAKARRSPANKAAMTEAWERCQEKCECGCGIEFDRSNGPKGEGYPEAHHIRYDPPQVVYLRRNCHHRIEMTLHGHRHAQRRK